MYDIISTLQDMLITPNNPIEINNSLDIFHTLMLNGNFKAFTALNN